MTFKEEFFSAMLHILSAPFRDTSVLWQLIPILLVLVVLGGYFILWREELGWNSALTNALTLFWVVMTSMQVIFGDDVLFSIPKFIAFSIITAYTMFLLVIVFAHKFSNRVTFTIADPLLIHYTGMMVVLWAHGLIKFSAMVVLAMLALFVILALIHVILGKLFGKELEEDTSVQSFIMPELLPESEQESVANPQQPLPQNAPTMEPRAPVQIRQPTYRQPVQNHSRRIL